MTLWRMDDVRGDDQQSSSFHIRRISTHSIEGWNSVGRHLEYMVLLFSFSKWESIIPTGAGGTQSILCFVPSCQVLKKSCVLSFSILYHLPVFSVNLTTVPKSWTDLNFVCVCSTHRPHGSVQYSTVQHNTPILLFIVDSTRLDSTTDTCQFKKKTNCPCIEESRCACWSSHSHIAAGAPHGGRQRSVELIVFGQSSQERDTHPPTVARLPGIVYVWRDYCQHIVILRCRDNLCWCSCVNHNFAVDTGKRIYYI